MHLLSKPLLIVSTMVLLPLLLTVCPKPQKASQTQPSLGIEIALSKGPFYLPASAPGKTISAVLRVPHYGDSGPSEDMVSAVKIVPQMESDKIRITVYALYGDTSKVKICSDWNLLKATTVASYVASEGEEVTFPQLSELGVRFGEKPLSLQIVPKKNFTLPPMNREGGGSGCGCASCGELRCCPNPGQCMGCGDCGQVCCGG